MHLATAKAEGEETSSLMVSHHQTLHVAKLGRHVEDRRELAEVGHHHLVMAAMLLLQLKGALIVVGGLLLVLVLELQQHKREWQRRHGIDGVGKEMKERNDM